MIVVLLSFDFVMFFPFAVIDYSVNIALWDAVQFLFPNEVKSRKAVDASNISTKKSRQPSEMPPLHAFLQTFNRRYCSYTALPHISCIFKKF